MIHNRKRCYRVDSTILIPIPNCPGGPGILQVVYTAILVSTMVFHPPPCPERFFSLGTYFLNGITLLLSLSFYSLLFILKITLQKYFYTIFKCFLYYMATSQLKQQISCCLTIRLFPLWGFDKYCSSEQIMISLTLCF